MEIGVARDANLRLREVLPRLRLDSALRAGVGQLAERCGGGGGSTS